MAQGSGQSGGATAGPAAGDTRAESELICVYNKDRQGRYTMANPATCLAFGRNLSDILGQDDRALLPKEAERIEAQDSAVLVEGKILTREERIFIEGAPRIYRTVKSPIRDQSGEIIGLTGVSWDITGSRASEIAHRDEHQRIREILDNLFAFVALLDPRGVVLEINREPLERGGYAREEIIGQNFFDTPWWTHDPQVRSQLISDIEAAARGQRIRHDVTNKMGGDEILTVDFQLSPLFAQDGSVRNLLATAVDVSNRKRAETALVHQMEILAQAQSVAGIGSWTLDFVTNQAKASGELNKLLGLDPDAQLTPEGYQAFNHPDDRPMVEAAWQAILRGETNEITYRNVINGEVRWMNSRVDISFDADGKPRFAIGTLQDITEQKRNEIKLQEYRENLEEIVALRTRELKDASSRLNEIVFALESVGTAIFWNDAETGVFTAVNQHAAELLGYRVDELVGKTVGDIDPNFPMSAYRDVVDSLREQGFVRFETMQRRKDGALIPVEMTVYRQPRAPGQPDRLLSFGLEIGERKAAEQALLEAKAQAEAANLAKSSFLATVSHEIRTPMNAIIGMALLALKTELSEQQRDYLQKILGSSELLLGIINDILDFSKIDAGKMTLEHKEFDLEALLEKIMLQLTEAANLKHLEVLVEITPETPRYLFGDELRLGQILLNLGSNAVKFTESGEIAIHVAPVAEGDRNMIRFEVADTGIGLSAPQIEGLFQSFHQADSSITRRYGGSGLGLAISKNLVEMMGGEIGVESTPGKGSVFWFTINATAGRGKTVAHREHPNLRGRRALVIDDHPKARRLLEGQLQRMGLDVTAVGDGPSGLAALQRADQQGQPYSFAFIDQIMPEMTGLDVARSIPDLNLAAAPTCILVTGQTSAKVSRHARELGFARVLHKPVSASRLFEALERSLGLRGPDDRSSSAFSFQPFVETEALAGARALLVEDNDLNQEVATAFLREAGLSVDLAVNGREAVMMVQRSPYDIVLMDMQMPVMDGLSATREIRKMPQFVNLPIVAMTANAMDADRERCLAAGMNDHIAKPIDPRLLTAKLCQWIRRADAVSGSPGVETAPEPQTPPAASDQLQRLRSVVGLDVDRGLGRCLGRGSLYLSLLSKFVSGQEHAADHIAAALASGRYEAAEQLAHTLKGVSAQIGADRISAHAERLEQGLAAQEGVGPLVDLLRRDLSVLVEGLKEHVGALGVDEHDEAFDIETWRRVRDDLLALLDDDDVACVDVLEAHRSLVRKGLGGSYESFARAVGTFDFASARRTLANAG